MELKHPVYRVCAVPFVLCLLQKTTRAHRTGPCLPTWCIFSRNWYAMTYFPTMCTCAHSYPVGIWTLVGPLRSSPITRPTTNLQLRPRAGDQLTTRACKMTMVPCSLASIWSRQSWMSRFAEFVIKMKQASYVAVFWDVACCQGDIWGTRKRGG
jgi:hypothetical protein